MLDKHDLISKLKDLAIDIGRTPTRDEFRKSGPGIETAIEGHFDNYAMLVQAAGLDPVVRKKKPLNNSIFEVDVQRHVERYNSQPLIPAKPEYPHAAIISDIHFPFHSQKVLDRFFRYVGDEKPEHVIIAGDVWDLYSHAKFPRSHNVFTPKDEETLAKNLTIRFWEEIKRLHPQANCHLLLGNHDVRPLKRTMEVQPYIEHWIQEKMAQLFSFEGVNTILDPRQELYLNDETIVHHGYRSKLGDHRDYALMNAIVGHTHRPGVVWRKIRGSQVFELNCGLAGDPNAKGLTYTSQKIVDWVNAFGVLEPDGPRNIVV